MSTILAVDDSATMRKCLEITFAGTDMKLVTCDSANAALEQVKSLGPDLVIADASLPPSDGYELCSNIKLAAPNVPVLMLSSKHHPFDAAKGAQADDHIDKPFDTQVLQDRARKLLEAGPTAAAEPPAAPAAETQVGAPAPAPPQRPAAPAPAAGGKIPAPRRRRPTPAMMATPQPGQKTPTPAGGGRRPVPFAMPSTLKKTAPSPTPAGGEAPRKGTAQPTMAFGSRPKAPAGTPKPPEAAPSPEPPMPAPTPKPAEAAPPEAAPPEAAPPEAVSPEPPTPKPPEAAPAAAAIPAAVAADLEGKLAGLGLDKAQVEGVLALSREVVEQVVWEVVPDLAETLIKEEIARLTED